MAPIKLSDNHRRSISITLQLVDQALCEWNDWCAGKIQSGLLYQQLDTLSEIQKSELRNKIENVRKLIARLRDELDLATKTVRTGHSIAAHSSLLWEMLTELNSRGLMAYGMVPEELADYLDPIGDELAQQMNTITALLSEPTSRVIRS